MGLALEGISYWIDKRPEDLVESRFSKEFVMKGIELILTLNYFVFDDNGTYKSEEWQWELKLQSSSQY